MSWVPSIKILSIDNKYVQMIINFLKKLFSNSDEVGSKRVVAFMFALTVIAAAIVAMCGGAAIPQWMFLELLLSMLTLFGYNTYLTSKTLQVKSDVASDVSKNGSTPDTNDAVKEILQSDKP